MHYACSVMFLRHLRDYFGVKYELSAFKMPVTKDEDDEETPLQMGDPNKVAVIGVGVGYSNIVKQAL